MMQRGKWINDDDPDDVLELEGYWEYSCFGDFTAIALDGGDGTFAVRGDVPTWYAWGDWKLVK